MEMFQDGMEVNLYQGYLPMMGPMSVLGYQFLPINSMLMEVSVHSEGICT